MGPEERVSTGLCIVCIGFGALFLLFSDDWHLVVRGDWRTSALFAFPFLAVGGAGLLVLWRLHTFRGHVQVSPRRKRASIYVSVLAVATILVVAPFILYVATLGQGFPHPEVPSVTMEEQPIAGGMKITIGSIGRHVLWSDITVRLSEGPNFTSWQIPGTGWVVIGQETRYRAGSSELGEVRVWLNITDLSTDMYVRSGDFFTVTAGWPSQWQPGATYTFILIWNKTMSEMGRASLQF